MLEQQERVGYRAPLPILDQPFLQREAVRVTDSPETPDLDRLQGALL
jgi:hypothetical protein